MGRPRPPVLALLGSFQGEVRMLGLQKHLFGNFKKKTLLLKDEVERQARCKHQN